MTLIPWPEGCDCRLESGFWREPLTATSSGLLTPDEYAEDFGSRWRATVILLPSPTEERRPLPLGVSPRAQCCRGEIEAFIRALHGGVHTVNVWDFDYQQTKTWGTGRSMDDVNANLPPTAPTTLQWSNGTNWSNGTAWARASGSLGVVSTNPVVLSGAAPNEKVICAGDTLKIGSEVRLVDSATMSSASGMVSVTVTEPFTVTGGAVEIGAKYEVEMRLLNRDAGRNVSGVGNMPRYRLELAEAFYGA